MSGIELTKIIEKQQKLFKESKHLTEAELTRQAQKIVSSYENFLLKNPQDIYALVLFGKFLRKTGLYQNAVSQFLKADQINAGIPVVKQEIGNFLVEEGKPIEAFPFFLMAARLGPEEPIYHYNLGNFIYLFEDNLTDIENNEKLGFLMHESFKEAAKLDSENFDYHLRYAQSFFDFENSMYEEALKAWDALLLEFGNRSIKEKEYIKMSKARIKLKAGKKDEAIIILRSLKSKSLLSERDMLLKKALSTEKEKGKKSSHIMEFSNNSEARHISLKIFPIDANLRRMKIVTQKLRQEKMLQDLLSDAVQARILSNGEVSLELTSK